jgi:TonB family C-terminal domain
MHRKIDFRASRIYLLLIIPFSFLMQYSIPSFPINSANTTHTTIIDEIIIPIEDLSFSAEESINFNINMNNVLMTLYLIGAFISLMRVLFECVIFIGIKKKSEVAYISGVKVFISEKVSAPYTVLGNIFIPCKLLEHKFLDSVVFHEKLHVKYLHFIDIVVMSFFKIVFWYNPFVWVMKKQLNEVHEYEVDESMVSNSIHKQQYAQLLLDNEMGFSNQYFTGKLSYLNNSFSYVSLKQRIKLIMKSKKLGIKRVCIALPFVCLLILGISINKAYALDLDRRVDKDKIYNVFDTPPTFKKGGADGFRSWVLKNLEYPKEASQLGIQGNVIVRCVVDRRGRLKVGEVIKSPSEILSKSTIELLEKSPKWKPAKYKKRRVNATFLVPIMYRRLPQIY